MIRPISDLRNRTDEISRLCHEQGEPVFVTKNGKGDLVVMSQAAYERLEARLDLYALLDGSDAGGVIPHEAMISRLRARLKRPR